MSCILLYADDIVCFAENENNLQLILIIIENWCQKWRLEINLTKTNILHLRPKKSPQSKFTFLFDMRPVPYCTSYKYLGVNIDEFLDFQFTVKMHADSAGRALSSIITKIIKNGGFPYKVYTLLYNACVTSVSDYSAPVTGYPQYESTQQLHLRAIRAFLGVPRNACNVGVLSEVDLLLPRYRAHVEMVRHYNRMLKMNDSRLTKQIFLWDRSLNEKQIVSTWTNEVKEIFKSFDAIGIFNSHLSFDIKLTVTDMRKAFVSSQNDFLANECVQKPKLRTFNTFKDFQVAPAYIFKPLSFFQRRMIAKVRLGCLPIRIETGRYSIPRLPESERKCLVCKNCETHLDPLDPDSIENEAHFLFHCVAYKNEREIWFQKMTLPLNFISLDLQQKFKLVLNDPSNVKFTSQFILNSYNTRSKILN